MSVKRGRGGRVRVFERHGGCCKNQESLVRAEVCVEPRFVCKVLMFFYREDLGLWQPLVMVVKT